MGYLPHGAHIACSATALCAGIEITVQHAGRAAQEAYLSGSDVLAQGRIPPGGEITFTRIYQIGAEAGELRVSVRPNLLAGTTAYFVGQV